MSVLVELGRNNSDYGYVRTAGNEYLGQVILENKWLYYNDEVNFYMTAQMLRDIADALDKLNGVTDGN